MAGAGIRIDFEARGLERLRERLNRLAELPNQRGLWEAVGAEVESQTRRRLLNEKRSAGGRALAAVDGKLCRYPARRT